MQTSSPRGDHDLLITEEIFRPSVCVGGRGEGTQGPGGEGSRSWESSGLGRTFGRSDRRTDGQTDILPCALQDIFHFGAAAQKEEEEEKEIGRVKKKESIVFGQ